MFIRNHNFEIEAIITITFGEFHSGKESIVRKQIGQPKVADSGTERRG